WRGLEVPDVFTGVRSQRHNRGQEQVVPFPIGANLIVPRAAIADADIEQVQLRIVGHRIPYRTTTAQGPPFAGPGLGSHLHGFILVTFRWIAWHPVEATQHVAGLSIVSRNIAAHAQLGAAIPDNHSTINYPWCTGDGVAQFW